MKHLIFDGHLDLAWDSVFWDRDLTQPLAQVRAAEAAMKDHASRGRATVTFDEMRRAGVAVCLATVLARAKPDVRPREGFRRRDLDHPTQDAAYAIGQAQLAYYRLMEQRGLMRMIRTAEQLRQHWKHVAQPAPAVPLGAPLGYILLMEGADPVIEPSQLEHWYQQGLRVLGLAHYGQGHYAMGSGGSGPLTARGVELLREMRRLGIILDLTHSSDPSFWQALELFDGPVIASHNNCRVLAPGDRQYADEQIRAIIERGGVIGAVLDAWMLHPGWKTGVTPREDVPLETVVKHIDHICQLAGNARHVAIGSDLDGGFGAEECPTGFESIADLQDLSPLLSAQGYSDEDIAGIFNGNWLRYFLAHLR